MTAHIAPMPADRVSPSADPRTVLEVENLSLSFRNADGLLPIVTDVSFAIRAGEAVALVGESGCGKSITASAIMGIAPENAEIGGTITLNGKVISGLSPKDRRKLCGRHMGFIFQEPMTALHPTLSIGRQMTDTLKHNLGLSQSAATDRAAELLDRVGIPRARDILKGYVHELSGGMRQRVMIALAISCGPSLIIADEPTTALDVTIQAQVLDLLDDMRRELNLAMLFITHDLEVVGDFCDRAVVMYAGDVVERGRSEDVVHRPAHPYARGLIDAVPAHDDGRTRLTPILGTVPPVGQWPSGCRFAPRCTRADAQCATRPALAPHGKTDIRCWHPLEASA
ncbi:peptide/nickel transport system ATP-binding protein/oligopeptide transport system ATP-binding protein [Devosia lucknowensis]|uniref:Peptide/nickel transport system ATP-binding protein/oligopeptide transport system ATP-binding protein n=1 Tax=Devosia lucknowensis TaxID=1096929 RepID=A0A1Y6F7E7_9HYPH|nr:ABC transporter ATP-binding protein [Devosia lucknowensis]SMQ69280.1 peptide/nickel transport system ATP-binding protein/oligopeptide transport system ATP-binding protein [Devosia lucknowensis]